MEIIMKLHKQNISNTDVHLAKTGDKEAYVRLVRENKEAMYRIAKSIVTIEMDVEDAVSETILNAYMNIHKLRKNEYFKTWIIRILINECNLILKKRKREIGLSEINLNTFTSEEPKKDIDLYNAINDLEDDLKITTLLFYFEDMKYCDIAKVLSIREGTVKSRLSRAKQKLYKLLEEVK